MVINLDKSTYKLDKTKILEGLQCHKKLWFNLYEPVKKEDNATFYSGRLFGSIVRKNYGKGCDLSSIKDIESAVIKTQEAIASKEINIIYEAAFIFENTLVRTDVLIRNDNSWDLLEAKSASGLKEKNFLDIAIQTHVLKKSGIKLKNIKLIHLNKDFIYTEKGNYDDLTVEKEITNEVYLLESDIEKYIQSLQFLVKPNSKIPDISTGEHCEKPYPCQYQDRCYPLTKKINGPAYTILPYVGKELKEYCIKNDIINLLNVPTKFLLKDRKGFAKNYHKIIQEAHKTNEPWFSDNLKDIFKDYTWPFYFMDFEMAVQTVPIIIGTSPTYQLPFQWSIHKWKSKSDKVKIEDGRSFLDFDSQNIERKFLESLLETVGNTGTIFAHHAGTEIGVLKKLKEKESCKDLSDQIDALINRVVDTQVLIQMNFYSPLLNGSYKLKDIIKVIPTDISYEEEGNISGGLQATLAWLNHTDPNCSEITKNELTNNLLKYCAKDTLALYDLFKYLMDN